MLLNNRRLKKKYLFSASTILSKKSNLIDFICSTIFSTISGFKLRLYACFTSGFKE
jgi:hypothetical protein